MVCEDVELNIERGLKISAGERFLEHGRVAIYVSNGHMCAGVITEQAPVLAIDVPNI